MNSRISVYFLLAMLLLATDVAAEPAEKSPSELIEQLASEDRQVRAEAKAAVITLKYDAVEALVRATCGDPAPDEKLGDDTLAILKHWEEQSWTDPDCEAAIDKFVEMVRDPKNCAREQMPLRPHAQFPFAEAVRILDIKPEKSAAYLRDRNVKIGELPGGYYSSVQLTPDWNPDSKDWLYIANLHQFEGRELPGTRRAHLSIDIQRQLDSETLVECLKAFRKSRHSPFSLFISYHARPAFFGRKSLLVLQSYPELRRFGSNNWLNDISDEDWAESIAAWPNATSLLLSPSAGPKAIAAAAKLEHLQILTLRNKALKETDLEPLQDHPSLEVLSVLNKEFNIHRPYTYYLQQDGTGKWQQGKEKQSE